MFAINNAKRIITEKVIPRISFSAGNSNLSSYGKSSACSSIPRSGFRDLVTPSLKYSNPAAANSFLNRFSLRIFHTRYIINKINKNTTAPMILKYTEDLIRDCPEKVSAVNKRVIT